jgi:hypothetical protein
MFEMRRNFLVRVGCLAGLMTLVSGHVRASEPFVVEIIRPTSLAKEALYDQTVLWIAESFKSAKQLIEFRDREIGTIVGNGSFNINVGARFLPVNMPVTFKLRIDVRDNRYRMTFRDVSLLVDGQSRSIESSNRDANEPRVRERFEQLANSLDEYLAKPRKDF